MYDALRLADQMLHYWDERGPDAEKVAATLRRQHAEIAALRAEVVRLRSVLTAIVDFVDGPAEGKRPDVFGLLINSARTVLARKEQDNA